jgi:hypothetical protein
MLSNLFAGMTTIGADLAAAVALRLDAAPGPRIAIAMTMSRVGRSVDA